MTIKSWEQTKNHYPLLFSLNEASGNIFMPLTTVMSGKLSPQHVNTIFLRIEDKSNKNPHRFVLDNFRSSIHHTMEAATEKLNAAKKAIAYIEKGMVVGLGSGSTSALMIMLLGEQVFEGLQIHGVASSKKSEQLAAKLGIPLLSLNQTSTIDINIDGADEFTEGLQLIKGGGGALLREKIIAHYSNLNIIIADSSKKSARLGSYRLPLEVIPFAEQKISNELKEMELDPILRMEEGRAYRTDQENSILDLDISNWDDLEALENRLQSIPGIVETGLFLHSTDKVIMGIGNDTIEFKK